jgi:hypothetical protein
MRDLPGKAANYFEKTARECYPGGFVMVEAARRVAQVFNLLTPRHGRHAAKFGSQRRTARSVGSCNSVPETGQMRLRD